jgi:hypothetical protein
MNKIFAAACMFFAVLFSIPQAVCEWDMEFETRLGEYAVMAKAVSNKRLTRRDWKKLVNKASDIVANIRQHIKDILKTDNFVLEHGSNTEFVPNFISTCDERLVQFTNAINMINQHLDIQGIAQISKKSPLELVPLMRELFIFAQFVTANPRDYGHGVLADKEGNTTQIYASSAAVIRIMKPIILRFLLKRRCSVYKLSRITTAFCAASKNEIINYQQFFAATIQNMKRNTADDSRIEIQLPIVPLQKQKKI